MRQLIYYLALLTAFSCKPKDNQLSVNQDSSDSIKIQKQDDKIIASNSLDKKVYEYQPDNGVTEHLFSLVLINGTHGLTGKIFGPDPEGEHGLWFFRADLEELKIDSLGNIEFEFSQGRLYPNRITIDNYEDSLDTENTGISRGKIFYKGKLQGDSIVVKCTSEYSACYDDNMTFKRKN